MKNCSNCKHYLPGLNRDEGICISNRVGTQFKHVKIQDAEFCLAHKTSLDPEPETQQQYTQQSEPPLLKVGPYTPPQEQKPEVLVGNIIQILPRQIDGEWMVTAIGKTALLAINLKTQIERSFSQASNDFRRLNH
jgi:hypothetical protein